ncbi:2OG-Fe(II) oxygenase [Psychrobacter sp. UBA3962]|uniref:2OG-Fe(II) oxygenase n=1 Tax=Psychrobacter sp. UBA3962 TaxID=1947352 RepID=UPI0025DD931E|nr:2OG-Fe(II) oxygenase [Psychrobacter sp. UBA3962]
MTKVVKTTIATIESNLTPTSYNFQDPITAAIPPPLLPEDLATSKEQARQALQQLPPDATFSQQHSHLIDIDLTETQKTLDQSDFEAKWEQRIDDKALELLINDGFIVLDDVYSQTALLALQAESGFIDYRDAKLTEGVRKTDIRGDRIRWITKDFYAGYHYLQSINELAFFLNRTLFAGIRHSEAHYACYPPGFGYKWHSDNPIGRDERVISAVFYLNDEWEDADGGQISIIDSHNKSHQLLPKANRLVIFDSNLQHQVEIAHRQRYSIATWLRSDEALIVAEPL